MQYYVALQVTDCVTVVVPGWAAVGVVAIAAAPRFARAVLRRSKPD